MILHSLARAALIGSLLTTLSACGGGLSSGDSGLFRKRSGIPTDAQLSARQAGDIQRANIERASNTEPKTSKVWDLFSGSDNPNTTVEVNKYIWNASLDVLNFLPIESVDPFTGVIVTGFGTPPGGGNSYRATVYVSDPALDARALKVSLVSRGGAVSPETARAVEDAILSRARQLRIRDGKL